MKLKLWLGKKKLLRKQELWIRIIPDKRDLDKEAEK